MAQTPAAIAARVQSDILGLQTYTDLTPTTAVNLITKLLLIIEPQYMSDTTVLQRGHLDQMSPQAHRQLLAELYALKTRFTTLGI